LKGDCTCQDVSLIDYFLASSKVFPYISDFKVSDFSPLFLDVHKHLHITLRIREPDASPIYTEQNNEPPIQARRWSEEKSGDFFEHFSSGPNFQKINIIVDELFQQHEKGEIITNETMHTVVNDIGKLFDDTAKGVFGTSINKSNTDARNYIPWFDNSCKVKRKAFHDAGKSYNVNRNAANRDRIYIASREYKSQLNKAYNEFQNRVTSEIRCASKRNPKKFWNIIRKCSNTQRSKVDVPLSELYEYFKDLNFSDDNEIDHDNNFVEVNVDVADRILNSTYPL